MARWLLLLLFGFPGLFYLRDNLTHMATTKAGLGQAIKFGIGMIIAGFAILNAIKAVKRAARAVKSAGEK
jgi:hypothetical protein